jgi:hypothetical protein
VPEATDQSHEACPILFWLFATAYHVFGMKSERENTVSCCLSCKIQAKVPSMNGEEIKWY